MVIRKLLIGAVTVALPVTVTVLDKVGNVARVEGCSMQPALNPGKTSDYVFLNKWAVQSYEFTRGEVVSLLWPTNSDEQMIKRIIALEGDTVRTLENEKGRRKSEWITIPKGHCWVEGDHRNHSNDSNRFGPVALGLIQSKVSHVLWPPDRWQKVGIAKPDPKRFKRKKRVIYKDEDISIN